jgi:transcriptional regulator with XRE-family HTH domain
MMGRAATKVFREEVAAKLGAAIKMRGLSMTEAANQLNVSRQSLHKYLSKKATPRSNVLYLACKKWGIEIDVNGISFHEGAFVGPEKKPQILPIQLSLPSALGSLKEKDLKVKIARRVDDGLELHLFISFGR